jgi:hypothetical protein
VAVSFAGAVQQAVMVLAMAGGIFVGFVELSEAEIKTISMLDPATPPNQLSSVWREKIEPEIDRLVDERSSPYDRAYLKRLQRQP